MKILSSIRADLNCKESVYEVNPSFYMYLEIHSVKNKEELDFVRKLGEL